MDYDPQGSSAHWLSKRQDTQPHIALIAAFERDPRITRSFQLRIPDGTDRVVVDTPAALEANEMPDLIRGADKILVPVLPSDIDIHACSRCVQNLLLVAKVKRDDNRLGIIANRVRRNTLIYQSLTRFLGTLNIPIVATLRDSQNYVRVGRDRPWAGGNEGQPGGRGLGRLAADVRVAGVAVPSAARRTADRSQSRCSSGLERQGLPSSFQSMRILSAQVL